MHKVPKISSAASHVKKPLLISILVLFYLWSIEIPSTKPGTRVHWWQLDWQSPVLFQGGGFGARSTPLTSSPMTSSPTSSPMMSPQKTSLAAVAWQPLSLAARPLGTTILGCSGLATTVLGCSGWATTGLGCSGQAATIHGCSGPSAVVLGCCGHWATILGFSHSHLLVLDSTGMTKSEHKDKGTWPALPCQALPRVLPWHTLHWQALSQQCLPLTLPWQDLLHPQMQLLGSHHPLLQWPGSHHPHGDGVGGEGEFNGVVRRCCMQNLWGTGLARKRWCCCGRAN